MLAVKLSLDFTAALRKDATQLSDDGSKHSANSFHGYIINNPSTVVFTVDFESST